MTREPKPGERIHNLDTDTHFRCHHTRYGICYSQRDEQEDGRCFIYQFPNGEYNSLHQIVGENNEE